MMRNPVHLLCTATIIEAGGADQVQVQVQVQVPGARWIGVDGKW